MLQLLIAALIFSAGYYVSLRVWPHTYCRRCGGSGRNTGSSRRRFGTCRACGGSGRKPRAGTRMLSRRGG
jgi:DnaJ-class molecular chaperone